MGWLDAPTSEVTWTYIEDLAHVWGQGAGADEAIAELLKRLPVQTKLPFERQLEIVKAAQAAVSVGNLSRVLDTAPIAALGEACDEVVLMYLGYLTLIDGGAHAFSDGDRPAALCEVFRDDPALLARLALLLAAAKSSPTIGAELSQWLREFRPVSIDLMRFMLGRLAGSLPQLELLIASYSRRTGPLSPNETLPPEPHHAERADLHEGAMIRL